MSHTVPPTMLDAIWAALSRPEKPGFVSGEAQRVTEIASEKWVANYRIGDLLEDSDSRLRGLDIFQLAKNLGLPVRCVFNRGGRKTQSSWTGGDMILLADAAALMIELERLGFNVNPSALVDATLPHVASLDRLTNSEVSVFQFHRTRHKSAAIRLIRGESKNIWGATEKSFRTKAAYKVTGYFDANGTLVRLETVAPHFRRVAEPKPVTCLQCQMKYMRGDADSGISHRAEHRKYMRIADPGSHRRATIANASGWLGDVRPNSPQWMHNEVYERAKLFRREFHYDFVQWDHRGERGPGVRGHLFTEARPNGTAIVGACCFRWREWTNAPHEWCLDWVWLAPPARRRGFLDRMWNSFKAEYDAFGLIYPLSPAMLAFLKKHSHPFEEPPEPAEQK